MITILSGSPRKNSNTLKVAKAIKNNLLKIDANLDIKLIDFNGYDIPSMNVGFVDAENLTMWQKSLVESVSNSNLVFVLSPEYNWFPSAEIIQTIHTFGGPKFSKMWNEKVFAVAGVSNGRGGRMPAVQLSYLINKVINVFNFESIVSAKMFESQFTQDVLDEEGNSKGNEMYDKGLIAFVEYSKKTADKWHK